LALADDPGLHFAAGDDERGEGWAHFVLVSQGLLGSGAIKRFSTDSSDTKSYCCTTNSSYSTHNCCLLVILVRF
jgi:hypothetical protein